MRLAAPSRVLELLNIQQTTGTLAAAAVALDVTYGRIEERLESRLVRTTRTDFYTVDEDESSWPNFRLSTGFVLLGSLSVKENGTVMDSSLYSIDYRRGVVSVITAISYGDDIVEVDYTAGFEADITDANLLTEVPVILVDAHASLAAAYMQLNPANVAKDKAKALGVSPARGYESAAWSSLETFSRPRNGYLWETRSTILNADGDPVYY